MKKNLLLTVATQICTILLFGVTQVTAQNSFSIEGTFKDYNGLILLKYDNKTDSTFVKNGEFVFEGNIDLPIPASLVIKDTLPVFYSEFILEPGQMRVQVDSTTRNYDGVPNRLVRASVLNGGKTNSLLKSFSEILQQKGSSLAGKSANEKRQFLMKEARNFIKEHPNEIASLIIVENMSPGFSQDELISFYENLDAHVKSGYHGKRLKAAIDKNNKALVDVPIKDFAQRDLNGNLVSISSLKGNFVLIEFWASWCVPCRKANPDLLRVYEEHKSKGFEILGVSLDTDAESWRKAIQKDKLTWLNVSDLKGGNNEVAVMFGVKDIPDNILIDREGKVVAREITAEELEQILKRAL